MPQQKEIFSIKPLEWEDGSDNLADCPDPITFYFSDVAGGSYVVEQEKSPDSEDLRWAAWFDSDTGDSGEIGGRPFKTVKEAQEACEDAFQEYLMQFLQEEGILEIPDDEENPS